MRALIIAIIANVNHPIKKESDVLESTGPGIFTNLFHERKGGFSDICLLRNNTKMCTKQCSHGPSCHFGVYAVHMHLGTWRTLVIGAQAILQKKFRAPVPQDKIEKTILLLESTQHA